MLVLTAGDMRLPDSAVGELPPLQLLSFQLGPTARGEALIAAAAAAQGLLAELERFRGLCEWVIVETHKGQIDADRLFALRDARDSTLFRLAPPASHGADPQDSVEWLRWILAGVEGAQRDSATGPSEPEDENEAVTFDDDIW
jgi:hypothetical protein